MLLELVFLLLLAFVWEVPPAVLGFTAPVLYLHSNAWLSTWQAVLILGVPLAYILVVILSVVSLRGDVPKLFRAVKKFPLGSQVFDGILIPAFVPHKSVLRLRFKVWSEKEVVATMRQRFWLHNPFQSVDLAALISAGEVVGFGVCLSQIQKSGKRAIPTEVTAVFHMKARGELTISSTLTETDFPLGVNSHSAKIIDKKGNLCAEITTNFMVSNK